MISPTVFISTGNEKEASTRLKKFALDHIGIPFTELCCTELGKPYIKNDKIGISVTHDSDVTALIITPFTPVGIDMEKINESYPKRVPERFFTEKERLSISSPEDFYRIWCKKESYVKLTGEGIAGISSFDSTSTDLFFTDLSEAISKILKQRFCFFICSKEPVAPIITIL